MITIGVLGVIEVGFGDAQNLGAIEHRMECFCFVQPAEFSIGLHIVVAMFKVLI